ncbi:MAG: D-glycerate dehydrogenase, partial [Thermoplasmata archaeon HGW-Thermoplasmata-2]
MHSVFITRKIPDAGLKMLEGACNVSINPADRSLSKKEIVGELKGKDALLCMLSDQIDADVIKASRQLKAIANYGVGYNNIDVAAATSRGIAVTNTPGVLTDATADLAWALLFAAARRIAEGDRMVRTGKFNGWSPTMMLGQDVQGKILGIIGAGRIGT